MHALAHQVASRSSWCLPECCIAYARECCSCGAKTRSAQQIDNRFATSAPHAILVAKPMNWWKTLLEIDRSAAAMKQTCARALLRHGDGLCSSMLQSSCGIEVCNRTTAYVISVGNRLGSRCGTCVVCDLGVLEASLIHKEWYQVVL